jgi:hypothetical protein
MYRGSMPENGSVPPLWPPESAAGVYTFFFDAGEYRRGAAQPPETFKL